MGELVNKDIFYKCLETVVFQPLPENPDKATLVADLGMDDLDVVEFCMALEEAFGISIQDEDAERAKTVEDFMTIVKRKMEEHNG